MKTIANENNETRIIQPVCNICGDDNTVSLRLEMPGSHKNDISVKIDGDILTITGQVLEETSAGTWLLRERRHGHYERRFTIDNTIDRDRIDAVYENGIMTLTLHVKEEVKPRKIEIAAK